MCNNTLQQIVRTDAGDCQEKSRSSPVWGQAYATPDCRFPRRCSGPRKVRVYQRDGHFVLQWWDPAAKQSSMSNAWKVT